MADSGFTGEITYDAPDDGVPNSDCGVEVWAAGQRNPFGIVLHSNGNLYGTDNGPNLVSFNSCLFTADTFYTFFSHAFVLLSINILPGICT